MDGDEERWSTLRRSSSVPFRVVSAAAGAASAGAAPHTGIVEEASVHESSLVACKLNPPSRDSSSSSSSGSSGGASVLDAASIHSSSLVATRLNPAGAGAAASMKPVIYLNATCPFAHKAWLALLEKEVDFEAKFEDLGAKSAAMSNTYRVASPDAGAAAKVPILVHNGHTLIESALVARYVASAFPGGADILPASPMEEYSGALFAETFNALTAHYFKALRAQSQEEVDAALDALKAGLKASERALALAQAGGAGPFVLGARFTLADIVTCTMVPRMSVVLGHFRGFMLHREVEDMGCARLAAWMAACMERPSMRASLHRASEEHGTDLGTALIEHSEKFVSWPKK